MDVLDFAKQIPSWLDQDLFDKAIRNFESDPQAKVSSFDISAATKPGDNFASAVFRAKINFTSKYQRNGKEMSVIIKTHPVSVDLPGMDHMKETTLFETEINAYMNILNHVQELLKSAGYSDIISPKLMYHQLAPKPVIMLEDVKDNGFDTMITTMHDDFEVSKMILKRLARFHAAGFYLQNDQKIDPTPFDTCIFKFEPMIKMMFEDSYNTLLNIMPEWEEFARFLEPVKEYQKLQIQKGLKTYTPTPGGFNVLNHGDFHLKNVLYKMKGDGEGIEDFMMLDYQISVYASPAVDLTYFLINFVSDENRYSRYDEVLGVYHAEFVDALKKFGYLKQPPSLLDVQIEMLKNGNLLTTYMMFMYPFLIMDLTKLTQEDFEAGQEAMRIKTYSNERYKKNLKLALTTALTKGWLGN